MSTVKPPARRPCPSCPYRRDVPSGIWDRTEYEKLIAYDEPTMGQPTGVFLCHQQGGRLCAGWVGCHDMDECLSLRLAAARGVIAEDDIDAILDYHTDTPLFESGAQAAAHGLQDVPAPGPQARQTITKLTKRRKRG